jgi:hypothetical protein
MDELRIVSPPGWEVESVAVQVQEILTALEAPPIDQATR